MLGDITKAPAKLDCLKSPEVLWLENLEYSTFHLWALAILICAILHTLFVHKVHDFARHLEERQHRLQRDKKSIRSVVVQMLYFLSEV